MHRLHVTEFDEVRDVDVLLIAKLIEAGRMPLHTLDLSTPFQRGSAGGAPAQAACRRLLPEACAPTYGGAVFAVAKATSSG